MEQNTVLGERRSDNAIVDSLSPVLSPKDRLLRKAQSSLDKVPLLRRVPLPAVGIISLIALVNVAVWVGAAIVLVSLVELQHGPERNDIFGWIALRLVRFLSPRALKLAYRLTIR